MRAARWCGGCAQGRVGTTSRARFTARPRAVRLPDRVRAAGRGCGQCAGATCLFLYGSNTIGTGSDASDTSAHASQCNVMLAYAMVLGNLPEFSRTGLEHHGLHGHGLGGPINRLSGEQIT